MRDSSHMNGPRLHLTAIDSTNSYTTELLSHSDIPAWTCVTTEFQSGGKGQRGKAWQSDAGENLLCTVLLKESIPASEQYLVSMAVALALTDTLDGFGIDASIKWPNDVLVGGKKIAGILIENHVNGSTIEHSIVGVGLNVNQIAFDVFDWPATSIRLETARFRDLDELLSLFIDHLHKRVELMGSDSVQLRNAFRKRLHAVGQSVSLMTANESIQGVLVGVEPSGALVIQLEDTQRSFHNGEIRINRTSP